LHRFIIDFVFDNLQDELVVIDDAKKDVEAIQKAEKKLTQEQKDLLIKTYVHEEDDES